MNLDSPIVDCEIRGGARLTLYANRLVRQGADAMESVPLAHLASVRVAFERDAGRLVWALLLLVAALGLAAVAGPLQRWIAGAVAKFGEPGRPESLDALLHGIFSAFGSLANLLPAIAGALAAGALLLLVLFWLGTTTLTLAFAATERVHSVRGRDRRLVEFAELVCDRLAARQE